MTGNENSIFKRISVKFQRKFAKPKYGKIWPDQTIDWYKKIHDENFLIHEHFKKYLKSKNDISTALEIGCGMGIYPIYNKEIFENIEYTGIDISPTAVNFCKENSEFNFICGDFIKMDLNKKFDLVYTHAVVDHVYDIDAFVSKVIDTTDRYAYINSYRGFFPNLETHNMKWDGYEGYYYNQISVNQIRKLLLKKGLNENQFSIFAQKSGQKDENVDIQTIIEITKN